MKPETATTLTVSLLLVASALCAGTRYTIDRQNTEAEAKKAQVAAPARTPGESRNSAKAARLQITPSDPQAMEQRLSAIFATSNEEARTRALLELISAFKGDDWALALDTFQKIGASAGSAGHLMIISAWTEADPQAAMKWAVANKMETYVISPWIRKDPDAAIAFLKAGDKLESSAKVQTFARAMEALGEDLPRMGQILLMMPESSGQFLVEQTRAKFSKIPADTLYAWADSFEGARRKQVMHLTFKSLQGVEAKLAFARRFPDDVGPEKYGAIYQDWLKADEAAALSSLEGLEPGPLRKSALFGITLGLAGSGRLPEALALTRRWPEEISPSLLGELLLDADVKDAPLILAEIPRIQDGPLKVNRYQIVLEPWFKQDPAAARKWLSENEVPEQVRKEFEGK